MVNHPQRSPHSRARVPAPAEVVSARQGARLTQREAAECVYVTLNTWQRWESGERTMPAAAWELFRLKIGKATLTLETVTTPDVQRGTVQ